MLTCSPVELAWSQTPSPFITNIMARSDSLINHSSKILFSYTYTDRTYSSEQITHSSKEIRFVSLSGPSTPPYYTIYVSLNSEKHK